jgi:hypothetical protein
VGQLEKALSTHRHLLSTTESDTKAYCHVQCIHLEYALHLISDEQAHEQLCGIQHPVADLSRIVFCPEIVTTKQQLLHVIRSFHDKSHTPELAIALVATSELFQLTDPSSAVTMYTAAYAQLRLYRHIIGCLLVCTQLSTLDGEKWQHAIQKYQTRLLLLQPSPAH